MIFKDIDVKQLLELMKEYEVSEISLSDGKISVDVKRGNNTTVIQNPLPMFQQMQAAPVVEPPGKPAAAAGAEKLAQKGGCAVENNNGLYEIKAPLVGTFYRASSPDADPFVEVGDKVKSGDVLCIVEAMKSMNEIQSEVTGVVKQVCSENAELVEYEQVLFRIDTSG